MLAKRHTALPQLVAAFVEAPTWQEQKSCKILTVNWIL